MKQKPKLYNKGKWCVYVVECADKSLYTGITTDIGRRLAEHNGTSDGSKYTRARRPVRLRYSCEYPDRPMASREEARIKNLGRQEKLEFIRNKRTSV